MVEGKVFIVEMREREQPVASRRIQNVNVKEYTEYGQ